MQYYDFSLDMFARKDDIISSDDSTTAHVRVVHIATKTPDVDVYINDKLAIPNLKYREFTDYIKLPSGKYNIKIYKTKDNTTPLLDVDVLIAPKSITTLAAFSENRKLYLYPLDEVALSNTTPEKAKIRFANFIENMPPVDVVLSNGVLLYKNLSFKDLRNYIELPPNTYTFELKLANTDIPLLYVPNANIKANKYYTLYLIGLLSDYPEPQMLIPLDGITYINE